MRTTIRLDDELFKQLKKTAAASGTTMTALIEDALREALSRRRRESPTEPITLCTVDGNGVLPGVDLENSGALRDLMDASDDPV